MNAYVPYLIFWAYNSVWWDLPCKWNNVCSPVFNRVENGTYRI